MVESGELGVGKIADREGNAWGSQDYLDAAERERRERLARWQAPPLSRGWPDGMP